MKILYIVGDRGPIIDNIYNAMCQLGVEMKAFCYDSKRKRSSIEVAEYSSYYVEKTRFARGPFLYLRRNKQMAKNCIKEAKEFKPDVLHGHMLFGDGIKCYEVNKKLGIDYVVSVRDTDLHLWFLWKFPWIKRKGLRVALKAKRIIFINKPYESLFLQKIPMKYRRMIREKSVVVPNGIDNYWHVNRNNKRCIKDKNDIVLLSVGTLEKRKNQLTIVKCLDVLRRKGIRVEYVNVGRIVENEIKEALEGVDGVKLVENIPKEKLIEYYRKSDIFVLPSLTETFGLVYAEAMTQGLPIIYSKGHGFDGQFEDGEVGYRVDSLNYYDIAEKIMKILNDYDKISERCLERSSLYDWLLVVKMFLSVY